MSLLLAVDSVNRCKSRTPGLVLHLFIYFFYSDFVSDFDLMMEKKKAEMGRRRKRRDVDIINDNDDIIMAMITQMKEAAEVRNNKTERRKSKEIKYYLVDGLHLKQN